MPIPFYLARPPEQQDQGPSDELLSALAEAGLLDDYMGVSQYGLQQAQGNLNTPMPEGRTVRDQYVAANPMEVIATMLRRGRGQQDESLILKQMRDKIEQYGQTAKAFYNYRYGGKPPVEQPDAMPPWAPPDYGSASYGSPPGAGLAGHAAGLLRRPGAVMGGWQDAGNPRLLPPPPQGIADALRSAREVPPGYPDQGWGDAGAHGVGGIADVMRNLRRPYQPDLVGALRWRGK